MANVQPEKGTFPIARELAEAFYKDKTRALNDRLTWYLLRNTYGRRGRDKQRRKTCALNWSKIAREIGADQAHVSRIGRAMIDSGRFLVTKAGEIGVQKDYDTWGGMRQARMPLSHMRQEGYAPCDKDIEGMRQADPIQGTRARILSVDASKPGSPTATPSTEQPTAGRLPNGKPDTASNRATLGSWYHDPEDAPDWESVFETTKLRLIERWNEAGRANDLKARQAEEAELRAARAKEEKRIDEARKKREQGM